VSETDIVWKKKKPTEIWSEANLAHP